jgi:CheY-like chemotaxis protein
MNQVFVLLVDDEAAFLEAIKDYLADSNDFIFECASSAEEALEKIRTGRYDVVVSDYHMPGMSGVELLREVRSFSRIPFILFTAMGDRQVIDQAISNEVDFYLEKGEDPGILFPKLSQMILVGKYQKLKAEKG